MNWLLTLSQEIVSSSFAGITLPNMNIFVAAIIAGRHLKETPESKQDEAVSMFIRLANQFNSLLKSYNQRRLTSFLQIPQFSYLISWYVKQEWMLKQLGLDQTPGTDSSGQRDVRMRYMQAIGDIECRCELKPQAMVVSSSLLIPTK